MGARNENNETVKLTLSNPGGGAWLGARAAATLTILENERVLQFGAPTYTVAVSGLRATVTVRRSGLMRGATSVSYATADGSAGRNQGRLPPCR
ncbi:MAG: hypothetical protein HGA82_02540 [Anaerolineales bacterium]|nr:hypothetical protein [Anaerolineales bacterium]